MSYITDWILPLVGTMLMCMAWVYVLTPLALRVGLVDLPNARKLHEGKVPLVGGVAIYLAMLPTLLFYWSDPSRLPLLLAVTALVILGVADDRFHLRARNRLLVQIAVITVIFAYGTHISHLGALLGGQSIELEGAVALFVTILWMAGTVNSVNMADGMDGLAVGEVLVAVLGLIVLSLWYDLPGKIPVLMALSGALIGFSKFNYRLKGGDQAAIFMGDAGSMFLGMLVVILMVRMSQSVDHGVRLVTMFWLLGVPALDMCFAMTRRWLRGGSMLQADHNHFHYLLLKRGFSPKQAVNRMHGLSLLAVVIGVGGEMLLVPEWIMFAGFWTGFGYALWYFRHD